MIRGQRVEYIPRLWFPSALLQASIFRHIGRVMQGVLGELAVLVATAYMATIAVVNYSTARCTGEGVVGRCCCRRVLNVEC